MGRPRRNAIEETVKEIDDYPRLPSGIPCADCGHDVQMVVDLYQFVGINRWRCVGCRKEQIATAAAEKTEKIQRVAAKVAESWQLQMAV